MSLATTSATASRLLRSCTCACQRAALIPSQAMVRNSSTSVKIVEEEPKRSLWERIRYKAESTAFYARPPPAIVEREMRKMDKQAGYGSLFDKALESETSTAAQVDPESSKKVWTEHKTSTGNIKHSLRKLNDIGRLIAGKPIDHAILQMQLSDKRVANTKIKSMLVLARDHAIAKGLKREELIVKESWVTKGIYLRKLDIKGRGRHGIIMRPESRMHVVLAPGPSRAQIKQKQFEKQVQQRLRTGAGFVRSDRPIVNMGNLRGNGVTYAW